MGRPLNKKFFTGANGNIKLEVTANIGGTTFNTNIVRQRSNLKYEVFGGLGVEQGPDGVTGLAITTPGGGDVITDAGAAFADFTTLFTAGQYVVISNAEDAANNGVYQLANVAADALTLVGDGVLVANAADTTMTLTPSSGDTAVLKLVNSATPAAGEMSIAVSPVTGGTEYARIINAHLVKTFAGNTYAWPDLAAGNFRGPDGDSGPQWEESTLQT